MTTDDHDKLTLEHFLEYDSESYSRKAKKHPYKREEAKL